MVGGSMATISMIEMGVLERVFAFRDGHVLDFTNNSFREFFESEVGIDIEGDRYTEHGHSKGKRLRQFLRLENNLIVAKALRGLWDYRQAFYANAENTTRSMKSDVFGLIERLEASAQRADTDAIERFNNDLTLDELVAAIGRDIDADRPHAAMDRLHTYCMKRFGYLLRARGIDVDRNETLNGRAGRVFNELRRQGNVRPISDKIMKSTVQVFELYNGVRNNESLAHDNAIIDAVEARFIFDSVHAMLRFLKSVEVAYVQD